VVEVGEDVEGFTPCLAGAGRVAGGEVRFSERREAGGFVVPVGEFSTKVDGLLVCGDGAWMVVEVVVGVAEAVPGCGLGELVAQFLQDGQSRLAAGDGLVVVAEECLVPADGIEGSCLPGPVAGGAGENECMFRVVQCFGIAVLLFGDCGESAVGVGLPDQVAELFVKVACAGVVGSGLFEAPLSGETRDDRKRTGGAT
jgi:hypothetical protein